MKAATAAAILSYVALAAAYPAKRGNEDGDVCKVETVTVKLTPLTQYVGHNFDLLSPEEAAKGIFKPGKLISELGNLMTYNPLDLGSGSTTCTEGEGVSATSVYASTTPYASSGYGSSGYGSSGYASTTAYGSSGYGASTTEAASTGGYGGGDSSQPSSGGQYYGGGSSSAAYTSGAASSGYTSGAASSGYSSGAETSAAYTSGAASSSAAYTSGAASSSAAYTSGAATTMSTATSGSSQPTGCSNPKVRVEWDNLPEAERQAYLKAERQLFDMPSKLGGPSRNRHEDMQYIHQRLVSQIHGNPSFLPWHRYFLALHEDILRNECGYQGRMPWWDETKYAGQFTKATVFSPNYFGSARPKTSNGMAACVSDGYFKDVTLNIGPGPSAETSHCLARAVDESLSISQTKSFQASCESHKDYDSYWQCSFYGPHAYGHDAVGAVMSDVASSPGEPIFFLHHGMVDRSYALWQKKYGMAGKLGTQQGAYSENTSLVNNGLAASIANGAGSKYKTLGDVLDTQGGALCYTYDY